QVAYEENKQGFSPLYIATVEGHTSMVETMLQVDTTLACTQFSDGTFPVHVAARMGNEELVEHFLREYPDYAKLLDSCGRNFFHIAAEHNHSKMLTTVFALMEDELPQFSQMIENMINARNYEGNTPLHMAAMKGHKFVMRTIWDKLNHDKTALVQNQKRKTALDLSREQLLDTKKLQMNARKCEKDQRNSELKVRKAIENDNKDVARVYAEIAVRKRREHLMYLRLATYLDANLSRLDANLYLLDIQANCKLVGSIVESLDSAVAVGDLQKMLETINKLENQFVNKKVDQVSPSTAEVSSLMQQSIGQIQTAVHAIPMKDKIKKVDEDDLTRRLAELKSRAATRI
ncbi:Charged multivesicular body protein 1b, partial [Rhynchospora pubera]